MKSKLVIFFLLFATVVQGQQRSVNIRCGTSEINAELHTNHPQAKAEYLEYQFKNSLSEFLFYKGNSQSEITIPVVFHVYGTNFNGKSVTEGLIQTALENVNLEFQGLNDDFDTVDPMFQSIRGTMNIQFQLAKFDPEGNETNGIVFHPNNSGFAQNTVKDADIQADAWDNYAYMNVYIQSDLFGDGVTNNSGVAWYPSTFLSDQNLARVVYNGAYLATNTSKEFAAVLTHEFGHWLNLIHPFEGGCEGTDEVDDTPQENGLHNLGCSLGTNCDGAYINHENYMGYNGAHGCYKMFTQGQVARMVAALDHPAIQPLWQESNLIRTGLLDDLTPFPQISWITKTDSYRQNAIEFAQVKSGYALEILDEIIAHDLLIEKPDGSTLSLRTVVGEPLRIDPLEIGTWTIKIPMYNKLISKTLE